MEMTATGAAAAVGDRADEDLSLGLVPQKLARTTTYPFRMMMHQFPPNSTTIDHTFYNPPSTHTPCSRLSDFCDVAGGNAAAAAASLQPFPTPYFRNPGILSHKNH